MSKLLNRIRVFYIGGAKSFTTESHKFTQMKSYNDMTLKEAEIFKGKIDFRLASIEEPLVKVATETPYEEIETIHSERVEEAIREFTEDSKGDIEDIEIPEFCKDCEEWNGCKGSTLEECIELDKEEKEEAETGETGEELIVKKIKKTKKAKK